MDVEIIDHSAEVAATLEEALQRGLEKCGLTAEWYAKRLCDGFKHATGTLRNSITHQVDIGTQTVYIGSNLEYAPYVELGTGKYYPGGRPTPGCTRTRTAIGITPTVTVRSRISSLPSRITRPNTARSWRTPSRTDNRIGNAKPAADKMSAVGFLLW